MRKDTDCSFKITQSTRNHKPVESYHYKRGASSKKRQLKTLGSAKPHLNWSMELLSGETHDYYSQRCQTIKRPMRKAEVVNEGVDVCWDNVENSQRTLKQTETKPRNICLLMRKQHSESIIYQNLHDIL